ncbi:DUF3180 domain-containing protein [Gryllotalpicola reticulitermitis]|uniref:DUF3180 domain-containing protein n=1 Tax=Gryllotalpicola reticulitermitis TaxID=1184153 RepID=A0ABV8Q8D7_9MICO
MKRTRSTTVVIVGLIGIVVGLLTNAGLAASGRALLVPPVILGVTLAVIGFVVIALAWPIRRAVRGTATTHLDPFRAARTAVLAKACSVTGALLTGFMIGLLLFLITRSVIAGPSSVWVTVISGIGGAILLIGGLIAEWFCTLPPPSDDDRRGGTEPGTSRSHA